MMHRAIGSLSLRARLTLWYSLALLTVLVVFGATVVWQQERIGMRRVDRELDSLATTLDNVLRDELSETADPVAAAAEAKRTLALTDRAMAIFDESGGVLAASWNGLALEDPSAPQQSAKASTERLSDPLAASPSSANAPTERLSDPIAPLSRSAKASAERQSGSARPWTAETRAGAWRVHLVPASTGEHAFSLLVAAPLADVLREQREAKEAMWLGIPIALLLSAAGGLWLASVGLRPITDMAQRAEALAPSGMEDLGPSERRDELGQLARAFNGLVARLRQALRTQRQFMADASHELRTPVSVIQSAADVTLARDSRGESDYREALWMVGAEARRLGRLVDDMLVLARADAGGYPLRHANVYLNEIAADCRRSLEVLARERGVTIRTSAPDDVPFCGDESLLRRMILNLLQNAVTYTRAGTAVTVDVAPNGRQVYIRVKDEGEGVAEIDRARIFDRFVQLDSARRSAGVGLGLPIARWIAEAHGGMLELEESGGAGSTFRVTLPSSANA